MTAPSYSTDLTTINDATDVASWSESSDGNWDDSVSGPDDEPDYYISDQSGGGTPQCISCTTTKTGVASMIGDNGSGITWTSGDCVFVWMVHWAGASVNTYANGGFRLIAGEGLGDFKAWDVGGSDRAPNPRGGWYNYVADWEVTADDTVGTPGTQPRYFGGAVSMINGISKGYPFGIDIVRYGRGELIVEYGETANYATFAGMAAANDGTGAQWGLFEAVQGGYLWKGLLSLGTASNAVDMRDTSGASIAIDDTPKVTSAFNAIEVNNASSNVEWTGASFTALGTQSPGSFTMNAAATIDWLLCSFIAMGAFTFIGGNVTVSGCTFRSCGQVDGGSSAVDFQDTRILTPTVAADDSAFVWGPTTDTDGYLDGMTFSKGSNDHHAIEFGNSTASTYNLRDIAVGTGFSSSNGQNSSTFYVAATTGTVTINVYNGSGNFSYKSAGATVVLNVNEVEVKVTAKDASSLNNVQGARVLLMAASGGSLPYNASVGITRSGSTATVSHTGHGFETGDKVQIDGANEQEYNCIATITVTGVDAYTYTVTGAPSTPATGSPNATAVLLDGTTNASGEISTTFPYASAQPISGRVRKGTNTPRYKTAPLVGSISSSGYNQTSFLVSDE